MSTEKTLKLSKEDLSQIRVELKMRRLYCEEEIKSANELDAPADYWQAEFDTVTRLIRLLDENL